MAKKIRGTCPAQWLCGFSLVDPEFLHQRNLEREHTLVEPRCHRADTREQERDSAKRTIRVEPRCHRADTLDND